MSFVEDNLSVVSSSSVRKHKSRNIVVTFEHKSDKIAMTFEWIMENYQVAHKLAGLANLPPCKNLTNFL